MGIEMEIAQQSAIKFAQNNLKLSYASELARAAQDLAVVSGKNSTETFNMLTHAVITGRSEVLKSVGIQKSAGQMYETFARSIGKSANALTYQEKQTAVATGALKEAAKVAGVYEAAMDSPGKVLRSFKRITNEIHVAIGGLLLKGLGPMIKAMYDVYKNISKALTSSETFKNIMSALGMVIVKLTAPVTAFLTYISDLIKKFTEAKAPVEQLDGALTSSQTTIVSMAEKFEMLLPVLASVGSVSPYVGLFGTVWGIMNSFRGLANVQQASLASVAPGIAEALIATAIGLFAAIPAVVAYNRYSHDVDRLAIRFETFIEEFSNILNRQAR
jgi:biopolymer transport protein ExbB/TolQ